MGHHMRWCQRGRGPKLRPNTGQSWCNIEGESTGSVEGNLDRGLTIIRNTLTNLVAGPNAPWVQKCVEQIVLEYTPARQLCLCSNLSEFALVVASIHHSLESSSDAGDDSMWDKQVAESEAVTAADNVPASARDIGPAATGDIA
eukprot:3260743-Amphidinium_carterae.1